ncbi:MAG: hypothetical protein GY800_00980 [Planctomycetes bacterium]|nr:hypothetical protein [Planctomycetota bacterium]
MNAADTAFAVLRWSMFPEGPPPCGSLSELEALMQSGADIEKILASAAAVALARLGLGSSNADEKPVSYNVVLFAAAVGAASTPAAAELLRLCRPPRTRSELSLHHALLHPALSYLPAAFIEQALLVSPLTGLLLVPPRGEEDSAIQLCEQLINRADSRRLLAWHFAAPGANGDRLAWRARIMETLRLEEQHQPFVLDIYEAAVALHASGWKKSIHTALGILSSSDPEPKSLDLAMATGRWWWPFASIYRSDHNAIRERRYLNDFDLYLAGIRLARATEQLQEGLE